MLQLHKEASHIKLEEFGGIRKDLEVEVVMHACTVIGIVVPWRAALVCQ